jgi:hypothetical protein
MFFNLSFGFAQDGEPVEPFRISCLVLAAFCIQYSLFDIRYYIFFSPYTLPPEPYTLFSFSFLLFTIYFFSTTNPTPSAAIATICRQSTYSTIAQPPNNQLNNQPTTNKKDKNQYLFSVCRNSIFQL